MTSKSLQCGLLLLSTVTLIVSDGGSTMPDILSAPGVFRVQVGSSLTLPCNTTNLGDLVLLWRQGSRIIFAGDIKVRWDQRFSKHGHNLRIERVGPKDNGEYTCEVETKDRNHPKSIAHKIVVLQRPEIKTSSSQHNLTVIKGSSVDLACAASGNPPPTIVWTKRNRDLAGLQHRLSSSGRKVHLANITINHAGRYTCTADNGVGNPVSEDITLKVLYPPVATAERPVVLGGDGCALELVCNADGFPEPAVMWYHGTMKLVPTNNIVTVTTGRRNKLTFLRFSFSSLSSESLACIATSDLGSSVANFTVIGIPGQPVFTSNVSEVQPSRFQLSWETPSYSNILEQSLSYKQVKDKNSPELLTYGENKLKIPNMQKKDLNCTGQVGPENQKFNFLLDKLEPGTRYQATIAARNSHGWGPTSLPITFKTSHFSGAYSGQPPQESQILPLSAADPLSLSPFLVIILASLVIISSSSFSSSSEMMSCR